MQADMADKIRQENRRLWVAAVYRWILGVLFLLVAFGEFPDHRGSIALGWLAINQAINGIFAQLSAQAAAANALSDIAERKTRWTIVASKDWPHPIDDESWEFWRYVDDRVQGELGDIKPLSRWKTIGLVTGALLTQAIGDLVGIGVAYAIAGG